MSEKVKLSKHVAEALDLIGSDPFKTNLYSRLMSYRNGYHTEVIGIDMDTIMKALVLGYEVEETPEEKVKRYFEDQRNAGYARQEDGSALAVVTVLDILNIKIEGVNSWTPGITSNPS